MEASPCVRAPHQLRAGPRVVQDLARDHAQFSSRLIRSLAAFTHPARAAMCLWVGYRAPLREGISAPSRPGAEAAPCVRSLTPATLTVSHRHIPMNYYRGVHLTSPGDS